MTPCESWPARFAATQCRATVCRFLPAHPCRAEGRAERLRPRAPRRGDPGHRLNRPPAPWQAGSRNEARGPRGGGSRCPGSLSVMKVSTIGWPAGLTYTVAKWACGYRSRSAARVVPGVREVVHDDGASVRRRPPPSVSSGALQDLDVAPCRHVVVRHGADRVDEPNLELARHHACGHHSAPGHRDDARPRPEIGEAPGERFRRRGGVAPRRPGIA